MRLCLVIVLVFYMSTHVRLMRCDHSTTGGNLWSNKASYGDLREIPPPPHSLRYSHFRYAYGNKK